MNLKVLSMNAGRKFSDSEACDVFLYERRLSHRDWGVIFVSECNGALEEKLSPYTGPHLAVRHWPRPGSFPMSMIINKRIRRFVKGIEPHGRAMGVHLRERQSANVTVIGVHGGRSSA